MPEWLVLAALWILAALLLALGIARWFRFMRDEDEEGW